MIRGSQPILIATSVITWHLKTISYSTYHSNYSMENLVCTVKYYFRNVLEPNTYRKRDSQKPYPPLSRQCIVFSDPDSFELILRKLGLFLRQWQYSDAKYILKKRMQE